MYTRPTVKGLPTKKTSKIIYYKRSCKTCIYCPCFSGFENMKTDFAVAGCMDYINKNKR